MKKACRRCLLKEVAEWACFESVSNMDVMQQQKMPFQSLMIFCIHTTG